MAKRLIDVTEYELAVLEVLWNHPSATIGDITRDIYGEKTTSSYATVQKLLERLEKKGCVRRNRKSFAHSFTAKVERDDLIDLELQKLARKLCHGSLTPILIHLAEATKLTKQDRKVLRKLIEDAR